MTEPKNKLDLPHMEVEAFDVRLVEKGSPEGKISWGEWFYALFVYWRWHVAAAVLVAIGFAADYAHANVGWFETKYGGWFASVVFGVTGLIRSYQLTQLIKREDTRQVEIK